MGDQIIQTFCKNRFPLKLGPPSLISKNFKTLTKLQLNDKNALKSNEQKKIWAHKTFKIEIQKTRPNNSDFSQN